MCDALFGAMTVTVTVPVNVPFGSVAGSAVTLSVMPAGVSVPDAGFTASHGLSTVAVNGNEPSGKPGMKTCCTTTRLLPAGTFAL